MPSPRTLERVLAADETLAGWQARHKREQALTRAVRRQLPRQLGERVHATELPGGDIELVVSSGAIAAAVRQRTSDLVVALNREGVGVHAIRVRVKVAVDAPAPPRKNMTRPDRAALAPVSRLAQTLPPGPLRTALARFLRRSGGA